MFGNAYQRLVDWVKETFDPNPVDMNGMRSEEKMLFLLGLQKKNFKKYVKTWARDKAFSDVKDAICPYFSNRGLYREMAQGSINRASDCGVISLQEKQQLEERLYKE